MSTVEAPPSPAESGSLPPPEPVAAHAPAPLAVPAAGTAPAATASPVPAKPAAAAPRPLPPRKMLIGQRKFDWAKLFSTVLMSFLIHIGALGVCWFIPGGSELITEIVTTVAAMNDSEPEPIVESSPVMPDDIKESTDADAQPTTVAAAVTSEIPVPVNLNVDNLAPTNVIADMSAAGDTVFKAGNELHGRASAANKAAMVKAFGGNTASEAAVISGMKWLANHQQPDGSWSFDHSKCKGCDCKNPGAEAAPPIAATSLALLAFMGGGHTHMKGDYQPTMKKGIDYLLKSGKNDPKGTDFTGGVVANYAMYTHGMATLALTEAAALTKDPRLRTNAQGAVRFIVAVQDPQSGGWRYNPVPSAGDTSVVGWQIMALKSAKNANIPVPPKAFKDAEKFLDSMELKDGRYKYDAADEKGGHPAMTPAALLCRMYLGWDEKQAKLKKGVEILDKAKPQGDMYYNYYATQVQHHWGGEEWKRWNNVMRDRLVTTQKKTGHEAGSWDMSVGHGESGGRLWMTTLSVMTLEVYYRHLPLYQRDNVKVDF